MHLCASLLFACVWARLWVISLVVVAGLGKGMVVLLSYFVETQFVPGWLVEASGMSDYCD